MSLLIKALDKAQNAKTEEVQAQKEKIGAQAQSLEQAAKTEQAQADKLKFQRVSAKQKQTINDKATENAADMVLSLAPATRIIDEPKMIDEPALVDALLADAGVVKTGATLSASPKNAANVFTAKGKEVGSGNKNLAIIAGLALLALFGMGTYFYQFIDNASDMSIPARTIVPQPAPQPTAAAPQVATIETDPAQNANNPTSEPAKPSAKVQYETTAFEPRKLAQKQAEKHMVETPVTETLVSQTLATPSKKLIKKSVSTPELSNDEISAKADSAAEPEAVAEMNETDMSNTDAPIKTRKKTGKSKAGKMGEAIASNSASISVTKSKAQPSVNPTLMSAYEAYNAGKDSEAQKLYKQVLQHDVRNVDALLGMGAIAQRQGRAADANGWYGKVLEVEPRNNIAQAALIDSQPQGNELNNETHLKNMLAKQPDDANLHVALGNLYAEQNQWPAAQQAYFEAYRLHASADNAFNLAVSLDQMGKPKLALPYYQRALALAQTGSNGIDKAALEARIAAIQ